MRRKKSSQDSLDLLLDTICNTFGGIVFISILVVILVNSANQTAGSKAPRESDHRRLIQNHRRLSESRERLESLRRAAQQAEQIRERFSDEQTETLLNDLKSMSTSSGQLHDKRNSDLEELSESQILMNETAQALEQLRQTIQKTRRILNSAERQLQNEIALRSRTSKLPRQQQTTKEQVAFFVKGGRLCSHASVDSSGNLTRNEAESAVQTVDGKEFAEPIVSAGLRIEPGGENVEAISERFKKFDPDKHFLGIVVWEDSFEHFEMVKQAAIRLGFKYQLIPLAQDEKVLIGVTSKDVQ
ncbi:MAG: hypothetical protein ABGZ35_25270 [Planctomycetaceae bacterium]